MNKKGGLADSPFFRLPSETANPSHDPAQESNQNRQTVASKKIPKEKKSTKKDKYKNSHDTMIPRYRDTKHDTVIPRHHDGMIETIRKSVKEFGKEAATHRFTVEEKKALSDILYAYKGQGVKTSENELTRIAINFLITDYKENGENSLLHQVIEALNG